jgi:endoglucanase
MESCWFLAPIDARPGRELLFVLCLAGLLLVAAVRLQGAENPATAIKVDQVGYLLDGAKVAFVAQPRLPGGAVSSPGTTFQVRRSSDNAVAFQGRLTAPQPDPDTQDLVQSADFSPLRTPGTYYLDVPGAGRSWNFTVDANVYKHTYWMAMLGFYGQRCGTAVDLGPEFSGYSHPACHRHGEFHPSSGLQGVRDNIGGWHDAGDYGRYIVNAGVATGTMLWAWEIFGPKLKNIPLKVPESGNGTPDILNEARWNLEWMLKMQDADGGVWHKQTSEHFSGFVAPQDDTLPSEIVGIGAAPYKSTCATAELAAVAAISARVYKPFDPRFAAHALEAARRAWAWTEQYPKVTFRNPPGVSTGEYGDSNCADERLWAAAELARTTGEAQYNSFFVANYAQYLPTLDSPPVENWNMLAPMALRTYALATRKELDRQTVETIRRRMLAAARAIVERTRANPYHVSLKTADYYWGSNGIAANYGMDLLIANAISPDQAFVDTARDNLHYLLGRNTFSLSWVTQVGEHAVQHPHHRPSGSRQGLPWPGLLAGGPNPNRQDDVLKALPADVPPAKAYADQTASYASNEVCINWQANLVFLLAGLLR